MSFNDMTNEQVVARYGGTTWERVQDRYLVAAGSNHTVNTTGGSRTVTLTENNLPSHSHTYSRSSTSTGSHTLTINETPEHNHLHNFYSSGSGGGANGLAYNITSDSYIGQDTGGMHGTGGGGSHYHSITRISVSSGYTGSGTAFSIEPPYIAIYMWKRTA